MAFARAVIRCPQPGCKKQVAQGKMDGNSVVDIKRDSRDTKIPGLYNGMSLSEFNGMNGKVKHAVDGKGKVTHIVG